MSMNRAWVPMFVLGLTLLGSTVYAQPNVSCGISAPLGATPRSAATSHTEPIALSSTLGS